MKPEESIHKILEKFNIVSNYMNKIFDIETQENEYKIPFSEWYGYRYCSYNIILYDKKTNTIVINISKSYNNIIRNCVNMHFPKLMKTYNINDMNSELQRHYTVTKIQWELRAMNNIYKN